MTKHGQRALMSDDRKAVKSKSDRRQDVLYRLYWLFLLHFYVPFYVNFIPLVIFCFYCRLMRQHKLPRRKKENENGVSTNVSADELRFKVSRFGFSFTIHQNTNFTMMDP